MSWLPPKDDGGSKITNYVIEKRVANRKTWIHVTNEPKERVYTVENLIEGHEYVFRIMAQNKYGIGDPLDSEPEKARNLCSEYIKVYCMYVILTFFLSNVVYIYFLSKAVPGQCEKPTISSVTHNSMTINWEEPEYDGGTPVIGYWLERKETTSKRWNRVTRDPIKVMPFGVSHNVSGLIEGSQYQFRVTAINAVGCGPPSLPSDPITATDPAGIWYMLFMRNNFSEINVEILALLIKYTTLCMFCQLRQILLYPKLLTGQNLLLIWNGFHH